MTTRDPRESAPAPAAPQVKPPPVEQVYLPGFSSLYAGCLSGAPQTLGGASAPPPEGANPAGLAPLSLTYCSNSSAE